MNDDAKTAIARMIAQKNAGKKSKPTIKKKVVIKKPVTEQVSDSSIDKPTEIQNLMELIDIKKIVRDLVQEELQRLGLSKQRNITQTKDI
jgi:hypothetical protein